MSNTIISRTEKILLLTWFALNLIIGALTVHEYGISIDEQNNQLYAADTLKAYPSLFGILYKPEFDPSYQGHGPAFIALAGIGVQTVQGVFPDLFEPDLWHFSYFISFLLAGLCLYWLTRRWFGVWTAWAILLLFNTQPMLLGHAFINPKDIPFMFFLTLSVVLGFRFVDGVAPDASFTSLAGPASTLRDRFQSSDPRRKRIFLILLSLALVLAFFLVVFSRQVDALLGQAITFFYRAGPDTWAGRLFGSVASQASSVPVQDYLAKILKLFRRIEASVLIAGVLFFLVYFGLLVNNTTLPAFFQNSWKQRHELTRVIKDRSRSIQISLRPGSLRRWLIEVARALCNPRILLAGVALGLATGVRAIGPLAGIIVISYLFVQARSRAWPIAIAYFLVAGVMTYIAWPYLWEAPIRLYLEELGVVSNFQNFSGRVLFGGQFYGIRDLPPSYLPVLLSIQFTEPFILGVYIGIVILIWRLLRSHIRTDLLLYIGLGFALPLFALIALNSPLYHNLRQVLFLAPPLFMLAAISLELLLQKVNRNWIRLLLIAFIALPGAYATTQLYPYQYVYYNSLVGGTAGAANRYELDYWRTSMRAMAVELNKQAPPGAKIIISGASSLFRQYARADLVVDTVAHPRFDLNGGYDYAIQIARRKNSNLYPQAKIEILIERDGVVLATVKAVKNVNVK